MGQMPLLLAIAYLRYSVTSFCPWNKQTKKLYVIINKHYHWDNHLLSGIGLNKEKLSLFAPDAIKGKIKGLSHLCPVWGLPGASVALFIRWVWGLYRLAPWCKPQKYLLKSVIFPPSYLYLSPLPQLWGMLGRSWKVLKFSLFSAVWWLAMRTCWRWVLSCTPRSRASLRTLLACFWLYSHW